MGHGEASIWNPRTLIEVSADTKRVDEVLTATANQTLFELQDFVYVVGTGSLEIHKNGAMLRPNIDWVEQSDTTFSLVIGATLGDQIIATGYVGITGNVDVRDTDIYIQNYQDLRDYAGTEITTYLQGNTVRGDGGEAFFQKLTGAAPGFYVDDNYLVIVPTGGDGSIGWIRLGRNRSFATIAAMVAATNIIIGDYLVVEDRNGLGPLFFKAVAAATGTDDDGSFIDLATHQAQQNFPTVITLKMFGAVGDDSNNDTAAIQAAVDYCRTNNRALAVNDDSIFTITSTLFLDGVAGSNLSSFELFGYGNTSVIKTVTADIHMIQTTIGNTHSNVHIHNFNMINAGSISSTERHCLHMRDISQLTVENMFFEDTDGDGLNMRDVDNGIVRNIYCKDTRRQGVSLTQGSGIIIENIRGEGTMINLVDIEPNVGDLIENLTVRNVSMDNPGLFSSLRVLGDAAATIRDIVIDDIKTHTLSISDAENVSVSNIIASPNVSFPSFNLADIAGATVSNIQVVGTGVANDKFKVSNCTGIKVTNVVLECDSALNNGNIDVLGCTNLSIDNVSINDASLIGVRVRNSTNTRLKSIDIDGATTGIFLIPSTSNDGVYMFNINTPGCTTGINITGANGLVSILDSNLAGATTAIDDSGLTTGQKNYNNIVGYNANFIGTAAPVAGDYIRGDKVYHNNPSAGGTMGFVCTASGTPGTWKTFGDIAV